MLEINALKYSQALPVWEWFLLHWSDQNPKYDKINRCHPHNSLIRRRLHRHPLQFFVKPTKLIISRESEKLKIFSMSGVECSWFCPHTSHSQYITVIVSCLTNFTLNRSRYVLSVKVTVMECSTWECSDDATDNELMILCFRIRVISNFTICVVA